MRNFQLSSENAQFYFHSINLGLIDGRRLLSVYKQKVDLSDVYVTLQELITPKPEIDCVADNFLLVFAMLVWKRVINSLWEVC